MKKIALILILILSSLEMHNVSAATDYDHNELLDYPGYGEAMYESIVEQTTFISGRYTENKDYVDKSINQVTDYAKNWWNEYERISNLPPKEKIREMINAAGGYALTVGDFIKNLFTDYDTSLNGNAQIDFSSYEKYLKQNNLGDSTLFARSGYSIEIAGVGTNLSQIQINVGGDYENWEDKARYWFVINGVLTTSPVNTTKAGYSAMLSKADNLKYQGVNGVMNLFHLAGVTVVVKDTNGVVETPINDGLNSNVRNLRDYVKDNSPQMVIPQPKAYLSCPDGTSIGMTINGGTFLDVNGQVMQVSKDGTATVSSQICNLGWEKPTIKYIDGTDQVGITTPDGKIIDAETGESITGEFDDELEDGCGTLCAIGKMLKGLGDIAKSIASIPLKILDGLLGLIVPDDLEFLSEEFNRVTAALQQKISITEDLKSSITGLFTNEGSNPLNELVIHLPAMSEPIRFSEFSFLDTGVPILRRIIGAVFSLYTIFYVYRKIVGQGGIMEK